MIAWAARDTVRFAPGTQFAYSNVGYVLLGALVEKLYAKPYSDALQDEIARPLGLRTLAWCTPPYGRTAMARGYIYNEPRDLDEPAEWGHPSKSLGGGALCSSARDLAAWNGALHGGKVLSRESYAAMITPRAPATRYGMGLYVQPAPWGETAIFHAGGIMGFAAQNVWIPAKSISVTVLFNSAGNGFPSPIALDIARAVSESMGY